jgi:hypothetical protein
MLEHAVAAARLLSAWCALHAVLAAAGHGNPVSEPRHCVSAWHALVVSVQPAAPTRSWPVLCVSAVLVRMSVSQKVYVLLRCSFLVNKQHTGYPMADKVAMHSHSRSLPRQL